MPVNSDDRNVCGQERSGGSVIEWPHLGRLCSRGRYICPSCTQRRSPLATRSLISPLNHGEWLRRCSLSVVKVPSICAALTDCRIKRLYRIDLKPVHAALSARSARWDCSSARRCSDCSRHARFDKSSVSRTASDAFLLRRIPTKSAIRQGSPEMRLKRWCGSHPTHGTKQRGI